MIVIICVTRQKKSDGGVSVHNDQSLSGFVGGLADELVLVGQRSENWTGDLEETKKRMKICSYINYKNNFNTVNTGLIGEINFFSSRRNML